jgi:1,4-alpha-glucan branching enzyme
LEKESLKRYLQGESCDAYQILGAHLVNEKGQEGVQFTVFAPGAKNVSLLAECTDWNPILMERDSYGFWSLFSHCAKEKQMYKYQIETQNGKVYDRIDPFAFQSEVRPNTASIVCNLKNYKWQDEEWIKKRKQTEKYYNAPLSIYEVHAGSWKIKTGKKGDERFYTYDELADILIPYAKEQGYTHLEFLPLTEYPLDASWGYQVTGYYSATSRYGTPQQLMKLVDQCHQASLGVLMDFVPAHFVSDFYALHQYDGTYLYESENKDLRCSEWGTIFFDFTKPHVLSFLKSAVDFWLTVFHFDGIRYDAVSRMLYQNGQEDHGVNEAGVWFLKNTNYEMQQRHPDCLLIAEDSSNFPKVTAPVVYGGLGFDYKWDLGFMNDTFDYMMKTPAERRNFAERITFSISYFYQDIFLLPFSHDEVVHGKKTIIDKIYGSYEDKFPQLRLLYLYLFTHPGKKLTFMGCELAEFKEWDENTELGWNLLTYPKHDAFHHFFRDLQKFYTSHPSLSSSDFNPDGFHWADLTNACRCIFSYSRKSVDGKSNEKLYIALNFSDRPAVDYALPVEEPGDYEEIFTTDEFRYNGNGHKNLAKSSCRRGMRQCLLVDLPPFCGCIFKCRES